MNSISLAAIVDSWRHGLWMHFLLRCNTWSNIAVKSRKDSEFHDVTFVSEDGLLCPAHKVMLTKCPPKIYLSKYCPSEMPFPPPSSPHCGEEGKPPTYLLPTWWWGQQHGQQREWVRFFFTNEWKVKFDKIPKLTFSPFGENVNIGILSKLTFHSLMKEKSLGNKVNKCHICLLFQHMVAHDRPLTSCVNCPK